MKQTYLTKTAAKVKTLPGAPRINAGRPSAEPVSQHRLYETKDGYPTYGDDFRKDWNQAADVGALDCLRSQGPAGKALADVFTNSTK